MSHEEVSRPRYRVDIGDAELAFRTIEIDDPVPTGRQLLEAAGVDPVEEHLAIALLPNGATETLRLNETFDLRGRGVERVIVFKTDRAFRFEVDRKEREWGSAAITGRVIKLLANVDPATHDLYREVRGDDPLVRDSDRVDLAGAGVERFYTVITETTEGLVALPPADRAHLEARGVSFVEVSEGGQAALILKAYPLPEGKFDHATADILVLLPGGYPDALVEMFYCDPWLRLMPSGQHPNAANVAHAFAGRTWQRWSRHNSAWRPGVDGIHTVLARIDRALRDAV